jgi:FAD/FMN-containing dehydrogenase
MADKSVPDQNAANEFQWRNWAGNLASVPDEIVRPSSVDALQALVRANQGRTIRAVGTGHSWSPLVVVNGELMVSLSELTNQGRKAWRWNSQGRNLVSFLPSATWEEVRDAMTRPDATLPPVFLPTAGPLMSINATGFVAAGCHGTGWNQATVSDLVDAVELVGADGELHVFSQETTPELMPTVRVSLGTLGIITKLTLNVEPMYRLHDMEMNTPTENVMGPNPAKTDGEIRPHNLLQLVTSNDYVELFWFPGSGFDGELWVKKFNRTTEPEGNVPLRPDGWVDKIAHFIMDWTAAHPVAWDIVLPMAWNTIRDRNAAIMATKGFVANAPRVLFYADQAFPVLDLELAIPIPATSDGSWDISNVVRAWWEIMNYAYKYQGSHPVTCCAHARFTRSSNSLLSPAYSANPDDRVCWIEFLSAYPKSETDPNQRKEAMQPYQQMCNQLAPRWIAQYGARPHWAKFWQDVPGIAVKPLYPAANLTQFNRLRQQLDPDGIFLNTFLKKTQLFNN